MSNYLFICFNKKTCKVYQNQLSFEDLDENMGTSKRP